MRQKSSNTAAKYKFFARFLCDKGILTAFFHRNYDLLIVLVSATACGAINNTMFFALLDFDLANYFVEYRFKTMKKRLIQKPEISFERETHIREHKHKHKFPPAPTDTHPWLTNPYQHKTFLSYWPLRLHIPPQYNGVKQNLVCCAQIITKWPVHLKQWTASSSKKKALVTQDIIELNANAIMLTCSQCQC